MNVILDYGMGNLASVEKAVRFLGLQCSVQTSIKGASRLILPGVGAFGAAMERLAPLKADIRAFAESGQPLLGICLGQQLLFETSEEMGSSSGLELLPGNVRYLPALPGLKIPHMGWNRLHIVQGDGMNASISEDDQVYFVHSLYTDCADPADIASTSEHGIAFPASVRRRNIYGTQFHPEKSGAVGLEMLRSFLTC